MSSHDTDNTRGHSLLSTDRREEDFVVFVPVSNPNTEGHLITLGAAIANQRDGHVIAATIVQVPDQTALSVARDEFEYSDATDLLAGARRDASELGAAIETRTIFSHRMFPEVFDAARRYEADVCVMGWGPDAPGLAGRTESLFDELAHSLPCDFLVFKDRGFDPSSILLPTTGGPHTELAASLAGILQAEFGSEVTLLHVTENLENGQAFLQEWATEYDLEEADLRVDTGDIETAIEDAARDHSMILIGASEVGVLARLARGSLVLDVLEDVKTSVIIAERQTDRGLLGRLFNRR